MPVLYGGLPLWIQKFQLSGSPAVYRRNRSGFPHPVQRVVEKCNLCAERLAKGELPHCVEASEGAIVVGDLEDPDSEIRMLLGEQYTIRRKQSLGTGPSVYYIV